MGEVYVAEDTKLQRRVALKVLPKEMATDPERRSRFEREARAVAALNHTNIVTVHSVEEADGVHFITIELVEGRTLAAIFSRQLGSETELKAIELETGREELLFVGSLLEIEAAPDGSAVAFCYGRSHPGMGLARLRLNPPSEPGGLPTAVGEPEYVVPTEGTWHVRNGGWSADSKMMIYTRDQDYGNIYELVERQ